MFTDEEMQELQKELHKLADRYEISESLKLTFQIDPQLAIIPERKFSLRSEKLARKALKIQTESQHIPRTIKLKIENLTRPVPLPVNQSTQIPERLKQQIFSERIMSDNNQATNTEIMLYLSNQSLIAPLSELQQKIYEYLIKNHLKKSGREMPDFLKDEITLSEYENQELIRMRNYLFEKTENYISKQCLL